MDIVDEGLKKRLEELCELTAFYGMPLTNIKACQTNFELYLAAGNLVYQLDRRSTQLYFVASLLAEEYRDQALRLSGRKI